MADREEIVEIFSELSNFADNDVHPVVSPENWHVYSKLRDLIDHAEEYVLALLKEQEAQKQCLLKKCVICPHCDNCDVDENGLLKEQKTKEGHWIVLEFCANEGIYCSECHMKIFDRTTKPKKKLSQYCPHCGSRNDQFFRDGEVVFR